MADNDFLSGIRMEKFFKSNSDDTQNAIGNLDKTVTNGIKKIVANQQSQMSSFKAVSKHMKSVDSNITKMLSNQEKLIKVLTKNTDMASKGGGKNKGDGMSLMFPKLVQSIKTLTKSSTKKDTFKHKNYPELSYNALMTIVDKLDGLEGGGKKKKKGNLLSQLSMGLAGAGLLGFLLTGDSNMLSNTFRFGAKYIDKLLINPLKGALGGVGKFVGEKFGKIAADIGSKMTGIFDNVAKKMGSVMDNVMKSVMSLGDNMAKSLGSLLSKFGGTSAGKGISKLGSKIAGSKVGKFLGKWGGKALAGGKSLGGKALNFGGKALKSGKKKIVSVLAKLGGKLGGKAGSAAFRKVANQIPIAGTLVSLPFAIKRLMEGDYVGATLELVAGTAPALNAVAPFLGTAIGMGAEGALLYRDVKKALGKDKSDPEADPALAGVTAGSEKVRKIGGGGLPSFSGSLLDMFGRNSSAPSYYANNGVDIKGIRGDVWHNFSAMFQEFNSLMNEQHPGHKNKWGMPGNRVQINSGYRSVAYQKKLYAQYLKDKKAGKNPSPVAYPGRSMHNYGYAMDMNSPEANIMGGNGAVKLKVPGYDNLFKKYGFARPVAGEPWHVEPKGLDYAKVRAGIGSGGDGPNLGSHADPIADAIDDSFNLPQGVVGRQAKDRDPIAVKLTNEDIDALSLAFGRQIKQNTPKPSTLAAPQNPGNPRSNL